VQSPPVRCQDSRGLGIGRGMHYKCGSLRGYLTNAATDKETADLHATPPCALIM
jgi:hypothetical protein